MSGTLKRYLREGYLAGCSAWTKQMVGRKVNPRRFDRVAIVAAFGKHNGITRGAFLQWQALRRLGIDASMVDATPALRNPFHRVAHDPATAYIFHSGGSEDSLNEIWTPSQFSRDSLARLMRKPIAVVPHYLPPQTERQRADDAPFTVLTMADSRSSLSRKNPEGAVRAFVAAFGQSPAARLLLKISAKDEELQAFDAQLGGLLQAPNIEIIREFMSDDALTTLYGRADALLSLHRSEGFGLPMLEALARGVPVVGTGWSGNMDFTTPENSILVPYTLVPVQDAASVYRGSHWAEPDTAAAAEALRRLADDRGLHQRLSHAAYRGFADLPLRFPLSQAALAA